MKSIIFITKSVLTPNLIRLITPQLNRKVKLFPIHQLDTVSSDIPKRPHLILIDDSLFKAEKLELKKWLESKKWLSQPKIYFHLPQNKLSSSEKSEFLIEEEHSKPFLPDSLVEILNSTLGKIK